MQYRVIVRFATEDFKFGKNILENDIISYQMVVNANSINECKDFVNNNGHFICTYAYKTLKDTNYTKWYLAIIDSVEYRTYLRDHRNTFIEHTKEELENIKNSHWHIENVDSVVWHKIEYCTDFEKEEYERYLKENELNTNCSKN